MRFSQRQGYTPIKDAIQLESMDSDLRISLWNALEKQLWQPMYSPGYQLSFPDNKRLREVCVSIWTDFFKFPLDTFSNDWSQVKSNIRNHFFAFPWHNVYDFVEFIASLDTGRRQLGFVLQVNEYLEREVAGYRLVDGQIVQITDQIEMDEVDAAIAGKEESVTTHLKRAVELLADRQNPDYRNSVKESISAVESQVISSLERDNGTLGDLLKRIDDKAPMHPAFRDALSKLYGYTSNEGGIRHSLLDDSKEVLFEEAKFMLVICSAFINYVRACATD